MRGAKQAFVLDTDAKIVIVFVIIAIFTAPFWTKFLSELSLGGGRVNVKKLQDSYNIVQDGFKAILANEKVASLDGTNFWKNATINPKRSSYLDINSSKNVFQNNFDAKSSDKDYFYRVCVSGACDLTTVSKPRIVLKNGALVIPDFLKIPQRGSVYYIKSNGGTRMFSRIGEVIIDTNGFSAPNIAGVDMFYFQVTAEGNLIPQNSKDYSAFMNNTRLYWRNNPICCGVPGEKFDTALYENRKMLYGSGCAARIVENNWEADY